MKNHKLISHIPDITCKVNFNLYVYNGSMLYTMWPTNYFSVNFSFTIVDTLILIPHIKNVTFQTGILYEKNQPVILIAYKQTVGCPVHSVSRVLAPHPSVPGSISGVGMWDVFQSLSQTGWFFFLVSDTYLCFTPPKRLHSSAKDGT